MTATGRKVMACQKCPFKIVITCPEDVRTAIQHKRENGWSPDGRTPNHPLLSYNEHVEEPIHTCFIDGVQSRDCKACQLKADEERIAGKR